MKKPVKKRVDLADICMRAVRDIWAQRRLFVQLAFVPVGIKFLTFLVIILSGLQDNVLRQGLLLLPAYFVEGWFVAVAIRMLVLGESWPFFLTGDASTDTQMIKARRRAVHGCGILYTLLKLMSVVFVSMLLLGQETAGVEGDVLNADADRAAIEQVSSTMPAFVTFSLAMIGLMATIWAFRYFCTYIPVAMGVSVRTFLKSCRTLYQSFQLLFVSVFCFVPFFLIFSIIDSVIKGAIPGADLTLDHLGYGVLFAVEQSVMEAIIALCTGVALAYTIVTMMQAERK